MGLIRNWQAANQGDKRTAIDELGVDVDLPPTSPPAIESRPDDGITIVGRVIEQGEAPYEFDPNNSTSFFILLEKPDGRLTHVWGVDLPRALNEGGVGTGDFVALRNLGRQAVTVNIPVKDAAGNVIGEEPKTVHRNAWLAAKTNKSADTQDVPKTRTTHSKATAATKSRQPSQATSALAPTDLLTTVLNAPFAITAAASSLVINGLMYAAGKAHGFYVKGRENGHAILGRQLDEAADSIIQLTDSLKQHGMGDLIAEMKATGRPAHEIFQGMSRGGPYQNFNDRFSALMQDQRFASQYAKLEDSIDGFHAKATSYAKTGAELNLDYSDAIERNVEKVSAATEGFMSEKDGVIKHLQELVRSISERISEMLNKMFGRYRPQ